MRKLLLVMMAVMAFGMTACTRVQVSSLDQPLAVDLICIEQNPKVIVDDFLKVLEDGIARNGMRSIVFTGNTPEGCEYIMTYTALRTWDITPYLSHAEIWIHKSNRQVASAVYHLAGGGGLSLMKWQGTKTKMDPVIDELFSKSRGVRDPSVDEEPREKEKPDDAKL